MRVFLFRGLNMDALWETGKQNYSSLLNFLYQCA